jgi:hypothetical protein
VYSESTAQNGFLVKIIVNEGLYSAKKRENRIYLVSDSLYAIKKLKDFSDKWINNSYLSFGYDSILWQEKQVTAFFNPGTPFFFVGFKTDKDSVSQSTNNISTKKKQKYKDIKKFRESIIRRYENTGYPFVSAQLENLNFNENTIQANLKITRNAYFEIDSIHIKGNPRISKKYVLYHLKIKGREPYNQSKINFLAKSIDNMEFIKTIRPPEIEFRTGKADLYLYLKSNPANFFSGMIGLSSDSTVGKGLQLTGDLSLTLQNSMKIGDKIDFFWSKYSSNSQNLNIGIHIPYIFILPIGLQTKLDLEKSQLDYLNLNFFLSGEYRFALDHKLSSFIRNRKSIVIGGEADNVSGFSSTTIGIGLSIQKTDNQANPGKGYSILAESGFGNLKENEVQKKMLTEINWNATLYTKLSGLLSIKFRNQGSALIGPTDFYQNQLYKIGGLNSLRGFDEQSILASQFSIFTIEPFIRTGKNSNLFAFTDMCVYKANTIATNSKYYAISIGSGLNIDTSAGIFSLVYALGKNQHNPLQISNSKIHFGYRARF